MGVVNSGGMEFGAAMLVMFAVGADERGTRLSGDVVEGCPAVAGTRGITT